MFLFFFFNDTATTEIYTLSLHDALPILLRVFESNDAGPLALHANRVHDDAHRNPDAARAVTPLAIGPARTDLFDVHVLLVHADDGESEEIGRASCRERV